jgi:hypothetical protein
MCAKPCPLRRTKFVCGFQKIIIFAMYSTPILIGPATTYRLGIPYSKRVNIKSRGYGANQIGVLLAAVVMLFVLPEICSGQQSPNKKSSFNAGTFEIQLRGDVRCTVIRKDPDKLEALTGRTTRVRCPIAVDDPTALALTVQADLLRRSGLKGVRSDSDMVLEVVISEKPDQDRWQTMIDRLTRRYGSPERTLDLALWTEKDDLGMTTRKIILLRRGESIEYYWVNTEFERLHLGGQDKLLDAVAAKLK